MWWNLKRADKFFWNQVVASNIPWYVWHKKITDMDWILKRLETLNISNTFFFKKILLPAIFLDPIEEITDTDLYMVNVENSRYIFKNTVWPKIFFAICLKQLILKIHCGQQYSWIRLRQGSCQYGLIYGKYMALIRLIQPIRWKHIAAINISWYPWDKTLLIRIVIYQALELQIDWRGIWKNNLTQLIRGIADFFS